MRTGILTILFAGAFYLQNTVSRMISIGGFAPNLLLCSTIFAVFLYKNTGAAIGAAVFTAVLQDLCFSLYPATGAVALLAIALTSILADRIFTWENPVFFFPFIAVTSLLYNLILWIGQSILGAPYTFLYMLKQQPGYILYNTVLMAVLYLLFIRNRKAGVWHEI